MPRAVWSQSCITTGNHLSYPCFDQGATHVATHQPVESRWAYVVLYLRLRKKLLRSSKVKLCLQIIMLCFSWNVLHKSHKEIELVLVLSSSSDINGY